MQNKIPLRPQVTRLRNGVLVSTQAPPIYVEPGGKPPKLRLRPGTQVVYEDETYNVVYAYRTRYEQNIYTDHPQWKYVLEDTKRAIDPSSEALFLTIEEATHVPRVIKHIFRDDAQARMFFGDIPCRGDRIIVSGEKALLCESCV